MQYRELNDLVHDGYGIVGAQMGSFLFVRDGYGEGGGAGLGVRVLLSYLPVSTSAPCWNAYLVWSSYCRLCESVGMQSKGKKKSEFHEVTSGHYK